MKSMKLRLRRRDKESGKAREATQTWEPGQTGVILCDFWDRHWCQGATRRVEALAPQVQKTLVALRKKGCLIVHAPSDTLAFYEKTPQRERARLAPPTATAPKLPNRWHSLDAAHEGALPIDDSDGGCDDTPPCKSYTAWKRQHPLIEIADVDAISDNGDEILRLFAQRGIQNVFLLGVHTNMCVLGRSFGIRRLVGLGFPVALIRDLTDTMYNPRQRPFVAHARGTELVIQHIETHWCPTLNYTQLL